MRYTIMITEEYGAFVVTSDLLGASGDAWQDDHGSRELAETEAHAMYGVASGLGHHVSIVGCTCDGRHES